MSLKPLHIQSIQGKTTQALFQQILISKFLQARSKQREGEEVSLVSKQVQNVNYEPHVTIIHLLTRLLDHILNQKQQASTKCRLSLLKYTHTNDAFEKKNKNLQGKTLKALFHSFLTICMMIRNETSTDSHIKSLQASREVSLVSKEIQNVKTGCH